MNQNDKLYEIRSAMYGHAIADAMGVPVEFLSRARLTAEPVTDYMGYGSHQVPAGTWSDDTSMALATIDSLAGGVDLEDMMARFCAWKNHAAYTATDEVFDMGITTSVALSRFAEGVSALECGCGGERDNGNGSLMRMVPVALYCAYNMADAPIDHQLRLVHAISAVTHSHLRAQIGCGIYVLVLEELLAEKSRDAVLRGLSRAERYYREDPACAGELEHYSRLFAPGFAELPEGEIASSGYVVATLEAAIWCLLNTDSYAGCILKAVNLGSDTDTVAAVAGGLAGVLYGMDGIPEAWVQGLLKRELLESLCERFAEGKPV